MIVKIVKVAIDKGRHMIVKTMKTCYPTIPLNQL